MSNKYQTIKDFMYSPFGDSSSMDKDESYKKLYEELKAKNEETEKELTDFINIYFN